MLHIKIGAIPCFNVFVGNSGQKEIESVTLTGEYLCLQLTNYPDRWFQNRPLIYGQLVQEMACEFSNIQNESVIIYSA